MNSLPSSVGWAAVIVAALGALADAVGVWPPGSGSATLARYIGIVLPIVAGLAHSTSLGTLTLPKWFNWVGILGTIGAAVASAIQTDPNASLAFSPFTIAIIAAVATFCNKFAHSLPGTGGATQ
jgi:hypothetical protein